jgi:hypothetical protein
MQSSSKQPLILRRIASQPAIPCLALVAGLCIFGPAQHAAAIGLGHGAAALIEISNDTLVTEVAARGGRAGGARVARAGGVRAGRGVAVRGRARGVAYRGGVYRRGVGVGAAAVGAAAAGAAATSYYSGYGPGYGYGTGYQPGYGSWTGYQPGYGTATGYQPGYGTATGYQQQPGPGSSTEKLTFEQAWAKCTPYAQQIGDWNVQGRTARGKSCMLRYGYRI